MYRISLDKDNIHIDDGELKRRLGGLSPCDMPGERLAHIIAKVKKETSPMCTLRKTAVTHYDEGTDLGFGIVESANLKRNLYGVSEAYILCATLGTGADFLLRRAEKISLSEQYITDAVLSAYIEAVCDFVSDGILEKLRPRFAPGYGNFSLRWQSELLSYAGGKEIGIELTESDLMVPTKSITAVMGIVNE